MRAAWFEEFGAADVKKRAGSFPDLLDAGFVIPNSDGAGVIEAIGEGVDKSRVGESVWVFQAQYGRRFGTAAEYVAISSNCAPRLCGEAGFDVGACLGIPAMTAHRAVFADGDVEGKTILVTGGAGRVGYYAVQWASKGGATVIATANITSSIIVTRSSLTPYSHVMAENRSIVSSTSSSARTCLYH
jgi:NADPH2:quinone reductase